MELDPREIKLGKEIGRGSFGTVFEGTVRNQEVAVKLISQSDKGIDARAIERFRSEIAIARRVAHPCVALYMGCVVSGDNLMIVTELLEGDVEGLIKRKGLELPLLVRMRMALDGALGMAWLHGASDMILHRDIKPSNFLYDRALRVKITDFGLSRLRRRGEALYDERGAIGTPLYMATEIMDGQEVTERSDVYSFGIVLWYLLCATGEPPFRELDEFSNDSYAEAVCDGHRPEIPADAPPALATLIRDCWSGDPLRRPTAGEVVTALKKVVVGVAIIDPVGARFWRRAFQCKNEVSWAAFVHAFVKFANAELGEALVEPPPPPAAAGAAGAAGNGKAAAAAAAGGGAAAAAAAAAASLAGSGGRGGSADAAHTAAVAPDAEALVEGDAGVPLKLLRLLVAIKSDSGDDMVTMEGFGRFLDFFGPWTRGMIDRVAALLANHWFHGTCTTQEAEARLLHKPVGTFLIRFSSSSPGFYTLSRVASATAIHHQRIAHKPLSGTYHLNTSTYKSLPDLIAGQKEALKLDSPCAGSPYAALWTHEIVAGYQVTDGAFPDALSISQDLHASSAHHLADSDTTDDTDDTDDNDGPADADTDSDGDDSGGRGAGARGRKKAVAGRGSRTKKGARRRKRGAAAGGGGGAAAAAAKPSAAFLAAQAARNQRLPAEDDQAGMW